MSSRCRTRFAALGFIHVTEERKLIESEKQTTDRDECSLPNGIRHVRVNSSSDAKLTEIDTSILGIYRL